MAQVATGAVHVYEVVMRNSPEPRPPETAAPAGSGSAGHGARLRVPGHALLARDSDEVAEQARHRERVGPGKTDDFEAHELELDEEGIPAEVAADRSAGR